jgi:hypothetical protein
LHAHEAVPRVEGDTVDESGSEEGYDDVNAHPGDMQFLTEISAGGSSGLTDDALLLHVIA